MPQKPFDEKAFEEVMIEKDIEARIRRQKKDEEEQNRPRLLIQLEKEFKNLNQVPGELLEDIKKRKDIYANDLTLYRLQTIEKDAERYELPEIKRLCTLAIGKRILNLELRKQAIEYKEKLLKKEEIELFFRQNRIKKLDYNFLEQEKIEQSTLIARPYSNAKGFVESDLKYSDRYETALRECEYLETILKVNQMFFNNYTGANLKANKSLSDVVFRLSWIPILLFIVLTASYPFVSFPYEGLVIVGLLLIVLMLLLYISVKAYISKPNSNNHMQQTIEDVNAYFKQLNEDNKNRANPFEWAVSSDFLYLEVHFSKGFPEQK